MVIWILKLKGMTALLPSSTPFWKRPFYSIKGPRGDTNLQQSVVHDAKVEYFSDNIYQCGTVKPITPKVNYHVTVNHGTKTNDQYICIWNLEFDIWNNLFMFCQWNNRSKLRRTSKSTILKCWSWTGLFLIRWPNYSRCQIPDSRRRCNDQIFGWYLFFQIVNKNLQF